MLRVIALFATLLTAVAAADLPQQQEVRVVAVGAQPCATAAIVRVVQDGRVIVDRPTVVPSVVSLPQGEVTVSAEGCWTAPDQSLWPAARLSGKLVLPRGAAAPTTLRLHLETPPRAATPVSATITCEISGAEFACKVPAVELDLRFEADGFTPIYLWNRQVTSARNDLGSLTLVAGASVAGWVTLDGKLPAVAQVDLVPESYALERPVARQSVRTNARGFFQFRSVAPDTYRLAAAVEGRSSARLDGVAVRERREVVLQQPLIAEPLATIDVTVRPATAPHGHWIVSLDRLIGLTTYTEAVAEARARDDGTWSWDKLEAGQYWLTVKDERGAIFHDGAVTVASGMAPVAIDIDAVPVRGKVSSGGEPVTSTLQFQSLRSSDSAEFTADEEGSYRGVLAREGPYRVTVVRPGGGTSVVDSVTVDKAADAEFARVDLDLPAGRVRGVVLDSARKPLRAGLEFFTNDTRRMFARASSGDDGSFDVVGLETGAAVVHVVAGTKQTAVPLEISDDDSRRIEIIVPDTRTVKCRLRNDAGSAMGGVLVRALDAGGDPARTVTAPDGTFTVKAYGNATSVDMVISHPAMPVVLTTVAVPSSADDRVDVVVPSTGGRLFIVTRMIPPWPSIRFGRSILPLVHLLDPPVNGWPPNLTQRGVQLTLAPGEYVVCSETNRCRRATVTAGGASEVDVMAEGP